MKSESDVNQEAKKRRSQTKISRIIINQTKKCEMIKVRKFYENEVTFLLRKLIDNEIRLQINVLVTNNLGK